MFGSSSTRRIVLVVSSILRYQFCILKHCHAATLSVDTECAPSLTRERQAKRFKDVPYMPEARLVRETRAWLLGTSIASNRS